jgi:hypothetical protein
MNNSNKDILKYALVNSLWTVLYIILIGTFFYNAQSMFGDEHSPLIPVIMLMLFVFSAALTGGLILGRPFLWYLDGKKKEALTLLGYTLGIFFVVMIIMMVLLYLLK